MNQFDGRKGLAISMHSRGMECAPEAFGNRHRSARALLPSTLLTAALVLTGCSGAGSTEGESLPGENQISTEGSSVGAVPTTADAGDAPMGPYGGGDSGPDEGGSVAGEADSSQGAGPGDGDSGNPAGGADTNPGPEGSDSPDAKDAGADGPSADDPIADGGANQPGGANPSGGADAGAADPTDEANGTGSSTGDEPDANEDTADKTLEDGRDNEESADSDEASAGAAVSGAFENMSKACKAISAQMLSIAFAPLTYSYGGGRAEAKQAVSELTQLKEKVPAELRDDFHEVEQVFAKSGHAYANFDEAAFEQAVIPIEEWVMENCPKLR
ncbi:ICP22 family protein [Arthrobacter monumenti]